MGRNDILKNAKKYIGRPYVWGGESIAEGGYDCSGYIYNVLRDSGFKIGRTTADGYRSLGKKIPSNQMQPGDLLFFGKNGRASHIAIYAGSGRMYESIGGSRNTKANPGKGVTLSNITRRGDLMEVRALFQDAGSGSSKDPVGNGAYAKKNFIRDVQAATGAKVDGIAGNETISKTVTISATKNRKHPVVKPVQKYLASLGYAMVGSADGIAGSKFTAAVKAYQADFGCVSDGEITAGKKTWKSLLGLL